MAGLEQAGTKIADSLTDFILNVDMTNAQYSVDVLVDEASKLGLDLEELRDYGFQAHS